ncbi:MAG: DUF4097 family beta strand repeat-containing protein [Terriglobales bacterium]
MTRQLLRTKVLVGAGLAAAFLLTVNAATAQDYPVTLPPRVIEQSFSLGTTPFVKISNINGKIEVSGGSGSTVEVTATEVIHAQTPDLAQEAGREVTLDFSHTGDSLDASVNGPFRGHDWHNPGYSVTFDFVVHVPSGASVALRTVNGSVHMDAVRGRFRAHTVNGSIAVTGAAGAGDARTVNGGVRAEYGAEPGGNCDFHTVNGSIHVTFPQSLNAEIHYRTLNGSVYTDYNVQPLAEAAAESHRHNGEIVFRRRHAGSGQIGHGGPSITLATLNGAIYIHGAH